ncbi:methyl-accepting chemotaxis protein [Nitrosarchaeum sp. AC2]|uniref:methyl-accepting chemotaxis protein n=1 Tax=Nitrosarchaeum sp. AC2 TaxID=2259673 RepID=UPI0015CE938C|nr:methyl-accepting chemotaxis protein [Nitrosarchaeum sp. AC2]QLH11558.1 methyl-accepting chemotaxis protein [Nitrosarchaeum sp. AC2]
MKSQILLLSFILLLIIPVNNAYSELKLSATNQVYSEGEPLFVYGNGNPNETLIIRLFSPDDTIVGFDQLITTDDGSFNHVLLIWPKPTSSFPFGTYTIEVISTEQNGISQKLDVKFTSTTDLMEIPIERHVLTSVFAPETAAINNPFRIFVQTTSDGLLIGDDPKELLQTTHIHLPSGKVETISNAFSTLHQGLYYLDYIPKEEGTYVFHVVSFNQGTISHASVATNVLSQDLGGISNQIIELNSILKETSDELDTLQSEIERFGSTLEGASTNIDASVTSVSNSVSNIEEASSQLNSLFFPIVASIGIIVALQIAILARRR